MLPHQGVVALTVTGLSIVITLALFLFIQGREKKMQALNDKDQH